jgi:hypothetical protein
MIQATNGFNHGDPLYVEDMETITAQICEYFSMTVGMLRGKTRKREIVIARQIAMRYCKDNTELSLKSIGQFFGGRDHSTVIHALTTIEDLCDTDKKFKKKFEEIGRLLIEKKDLRFKFFPESERPLSPEVNENLDVLQELKNQI